MDDHTMNPGATPPDDAAVPPRSNGRPLPRGPSTTVVLEGADAEAQARADERAATRRDAPDPLDGLAERCKQDPAAWEDPAVLHALAEAFLDDPTVYDDARRRLKAEKVPVGRVDERVKATARALRDERKRRAKDEQRAHARQRAEEAARAAELARKVEAEEIERAPWRAAHYAEAWVDEEVRHGYTMKPGRIIVTRPKGREGDTESVTLANFSAPIVSDVLEHDGTGVRRIYELSVYFEGDAAPVTVHVPAEDFARMGWVATELGARAWMHPDRNTSAELRSALQQLSQPVVRRAYACTGWQGSVYVHAAGAIGPGAVDAEVRVPPELKAFALPALPEGGLDAPAVRDAVQACAALFSLEPAEVFVPLGGQTWRSVLPNYNRASLYITGQAGAGKTLAVSIFQQHHAPGHTEARPPATFDRNNTVAAINHLRGLVGNALFFVSDAVMGRAGVAEKFDDLVRVQYNGTGARRLDFERRKVRGEAAPRCSLVSDGETIPAGFSARQRVVTVHHRRVPGQDLTPHRDLANRGVYALATSAFIHWIADNIEKVREKVDSDRVEATGRLRAAGVSDRTAELVAELEVGVVWFLRFAVDVGAVAEEAAAELLARARKTLDLVALAQSRIHSAQDPAERFVVCLASALLSGRCHVRTLNGGSPDPPAQWGWLQDGETRVENNSEGEQTVSRPLKPGGTCVGFTDGEVVFLNPSAALAAARRAAEGTGDPLALGSTEDLGRLLHARGWLVAHDLKKDCQAHTFRKMIQGTRGRFLWIRHDALHPSPVDSQGGQAG